MTAEAAIRAEELGMNYRNGESELVVFHSLSLLVKPGELVAVVGESGVGKSTLLHLLGGLDRPSKGRIYFGQRDLSALRDKDLADFRNRMLGFVWQNPSLLPEFTALENVMMPLLIRGTKAEEAAAVAQARLDEVGLLARSSHRPGELSGGEQQRVALARALAGSPKYLLADEPTGSLDFRTGDRIVQLLKELHATHSLTSIFVTHNLSFARQCDRVLELKKGSLQATDLSALEAAEVGRDATRLDGGNYV